MENRLDYIDSPAKWDAPAVMGSGCRVWVVFSTYHAPDSSCEVKPLRVFFDRKAAISYALCRSRATNRYWSFDVSPFVPCGRGYVC